MENIEQLNKSNGEVVTEKDFNTIDSNFLIIETELESLNNKTNNTWGTFNL
ncbi:hypothetical protein psyc5s11_36610 [Clostridium gelidum]|uniref:Uncharacterized protein n=1 Tax=Clostridium gelidum TaxID=704125 RepID=A0ABN6J4M9_9CLOT|nr:hypothetical protein [Clostridium gelidum]BCZ47594.1 hypothetical protein psyc5s11_36610 [Clostridium gelidum]